MDMGPSFGIGRGDCRRGGGIHNTYIWGRRLGFGGSAEEAESSIFRSLSPPPPSLHIYLYIYAPLLPAPHPLAFTRYCYCYYQSCIVYSIQTEGRKASRILSNNRAILLHQGGQCRWAGGMKGWLIRAQQFRMNVYLIKANSPSSPTHVCSVK